MTLAPTLEPPTVHLAWSRHTRTVRGKSRARNGFIVGETRRRAWNEPRPVLEVRHGMAVSHHGFSVSKLVTCPANITEPGLLPRNYSSLLGGMNSAQVGGHDAPLVIAALAPPLAFGRSRRCVCWVQQQARDTRGCHRCRPDRRAGESYARRLHDAARSIRRDPAGISPAMDE